MYLYLVSIFFMITYALYDFVYKTFWIFRSWNPSKIMNEKYQGNSTIVISIQSKISNICYGSEGCGKQNDSKICNMKVYTMLYPLFCDMGLHLWQGNCNLYF